MNTDLTDEHIVPEFLGGGLIVKNVCNPCNSKMGHGFEAEMSKSLFYKLPIYANKVLGKSKKSATPFAGVYTDQKSGIKFRVEDDENIVALPDLEIAENEVGARIRMSIDANDLPRAKEMLEKRVRRHLQTKGKKISDEDMDKQLSRILDEYNLTNNTIDKPEFSKSIQLDYLNQKLMYVKIVYELAIYHFGEGYLEDQIGDGIRRCLLGQSEVEVLRGQLPFESDFFQQRLDDSYHWVIFKDNGCYVRIFGIAGMFIFTSKGSKFVESEGIIYKFDFKTKTYEKKKLIEHFL